MTRAVQLEEQGKIPGLPHTDLTSFFGGGKH